MARAALRTVVFLSVAYGAGCSGDDDKSPTDTGATGTDTDTDTTDGSDLDGDGVAAPDDCDDNDPTRYPGAVEHCDGVDQNCLDDEELGIITVMPDQTFTTLAEAAEAVSGGETVRICPGSYAGTALFASPVTIEGVVTTEGDLVVRPLLDGDGGGTTLKLDGAGSVVRGLAITGGTQSGVRAGLTADITLEDLEIYDNIGDYGAGVQFSPEGGSLTDSVVHDNIAQEDGGGVYANGDTELERVDVSGNVAGNWGGGITLGDSASLDLVDVSIVENTAERGGGLFALASTTVTASGATLVEGNNASASGGGVYLFSTDWTGGRITGNSAVDTGGGLYIYEQSSVVGMDIDGNDATRGGGVFASGVVGIDNVQVHSNEADTDGGGLYLLDAEVSLSGTTVESNTAPDGGGAYLQDSSITEGVIGNNEADNGGGVFTNNVEATYTTLLDGTRIEDNSATTSGGGIYLSDAAELTDVNVLRNLSSDRAGGVYVTNEAEVEIQGGLIQSNTAVERGGGLYTNTSAVAELEGVDLSRNQALRGAGVYINNDSQVDLTDCVLTLNGDVTTVSGGGVRIISGDLVSVNTNWGEGPTDNLPDDVFAEELGAYVGYGAAATFACDAYACSPEP